MNLLVTIPAESRRVHIGKNIIRILGSPDYICVLQRKDRKSIVITPCAANHPMSFRVPDKLLTDGQCKMRINGMGFVQSLLDANGLVTGKGYQFSGRYDIEKNAVVISLEANESENLISLKESGASGTHIESRQALEKQAPQSPRVAKDCPLRKVPRPCR